MDKNENFVQDTKQFDGELGDEALDRAASYNAGCVWCCGFSNALPD